MKKTLHTLRWFLRRSSTKTLSLIPFLAGVGFIALVHILLPGVWANNTLRALVGSAGLFCASLSALPVIIRKEAWYWGRRVDESTAVLWDTCSMLFFLVPAVLLLALGLLEVLHASAPIR